MTLSVLIVDDNDTAAQNLANRIRDRLPGASVLIESEFAQAVMRLCEQRPHVVVLDLMLDEALPSFEVGGKPVWEEIWERVFVPVIIHTAYADQAETLPLPKGNPYVAVVEKKTGAAREVAETICGFLPSIRATQGVLDELHAVIGDTLKSIAYTDAFLDSSGAPDASLLVRGARRRIAATMDLELMTTGEVLESWEQYIVPPLGDDLLLGDVLRESTTPLDDAAAYRLVVTPSCDLVRRAGKAKVDQILVARCMPITDWFGKISLPKSETKARESLQRKLSEPLECGYLCLPALPDVLPDMAADFRALKLLPYAQVDPAPAGGTDAPDSNATGSYTHVRVASIDSPFREYVAWAYHQVSGRVGLPDRDLHAWAREALTDAEWSGDTTP